MAFNQDPPLIVQWFDLLLHLTPLLAFIDITWLNKCHKKELISTMIVRIIILAVIIWLVWYWLKRRPSSSNEVTEQTTASKDHDGSTRMVKCADCELFLPIDDALQYGDCYFCSQQHLAHFDQKNHSADSQ